VTGKVRGEEVRKTLMKLPTYVVNGFVKMDLGRIIIIIIIIISIHITCIYFVWSLLVTSRNFNSL
jgi:hypothetical protein